MVYPNLWRVRENVDPGRFEELGDAVERVTGVLESQMCCYESPDHSIRWESSRLEVGRVAPPLAPLWHQKGWACLSLSTSLHLGLLLSHGQKADVQLQPCRKGPSNLSGPQEEYRKLAIQHNWWGERKWMNEWMQSIAILESILPEFQKGTWSLAFC